MSSPRLASLSIAVACVLTGCNSNQSEVEIAKIKAQAEVDKAKYDAERARFEAEAAQNRSASPAPVTTLAPAPVTTTEGYTMAPQPLVVQPSSMAQSTLDYWNNVKAVLSESDPEKIADVAQKVSALRSIASKIDQLSAAGVDVEAIEASTRICTLIRRSAAYYDDYGDAERGLRAGFRDGLNNNPTRAIDEANAIKQESANTQDATSAIRKRLESKYNVSLPSMFNS